jgi:signal transduction histidine kinase
MSAPQGSTRTRAPSIGTRLAGALTAWTVFWGLAIGLAVWLTATHEVDELLDDALRSSAEMLGAIAGPTGAAPAGPAGAAPAAAVDAVEAVDAPAAGPSVPANPALALGSDRFAWQLVTADGRLLARSMQAPPAPWRATPTPGFADAPGWRVYGVPLPADGRMLYAAQTLAERREAHMDVAFSAVLAALALGLLGHVWMRARLRTELRPLQTLSERLAAQRFDDADVVGGLALGAAERRELQPVHEALEALVSRLAARVASEQAFSAHAAHALRTPLAGIDAQLAVALRDAPPALRERLQRVRGAAGRLQGVVTALLGLFRSGAEPQRSDVDLAALVARLPTRTLAVEVAPGARLWADADLLAAALVNLLDNAQRHGARHVRLALADARRLRLHDDGPGLPAEQRQRLQAAIDAQSYEGVTGLGLLLADRVARAHGGALWLPDTASGFAVEIDLGPPREAPAGRAGDALQTGFSGAVDAPAAPALAPASTVTPVAFGRTPAATAADEPPPDRGPPYPMHR